MSPLSLAQVISRITSMTSGLEAEATVHTLTSHLLCVQAIIATGIWQVSRGDDRFTCVAWSGDEAMRNKIETHLHNMESDEISSRTVSAANGRAPTTATLLQLPLHTSHERLGYLAILYSGVPSDDEVELLTAIGNIARNELIKFHGTHQHESPDTTESPEPVSSPQESPINFIGVVAHELRTPLTGLRGNVQLALMANQRGHYERISSRLTSAIKSVDALASLVQQLLDVSRLERGVYPMERENADLLKTVQLAVGQSADPPQETEHQTIAITNTEPLIANHDPRALSEAIGHLLTTTKTIALPDRSIDIDIKHDELAARIMISYEGESPPDEIQRRLLKSYSFNENHAANSSGKDSLGLELSLSRGIIARHGGTIEIDDGPEEKQHCLTVCIPLKA